MGQTIDSVLFRDLLAEDPKSVTARTGCAHDGEKGTYLVTAWGGELAVDPGAERVGVLTPSSLPSGEYLDLLLVHYLLKAQTDRPLGRWVSEKDIPGGAAFFRGPHAIPTQGITRRFGQDMELFKARCRDLGGSPVDMGDAAFAFEVLPRIPVVVVYWLGDADFPSEATLLYDISIDRHLPLDIIYALAVLVCRVLGDPIP